MKMRTEYKIEAVASDDATLQPISMPYLDTKDKDAPVVVATNGKALAVVPVELEDGDTDGHIPTAALAHYRKLSKKHHEEVSLKLNGTAHVHDYRDSVSASYPRPGDLRFPDWRDIREDKKLFSTPVTVTIKLDAALLHKLAQAVGNDWVTLEIRSNKDAVKVNGDRGAYGLIMPICDGK